MSEVMNRMRKRFLRGIHEKVLERCFGAKEAVATAGWQPLEQLLIESDNVAFGVHYAPTPRLIVRWVHDVLPRELKGWTFVDVGAGRGRVVAEAAGFGYDRVVGVDFAPELCAAAEQNIAMLPQAAIAARAVEIRCGDATELDVPSGACVFYLFNPFGEHVLAAFLRRVLATYDQDPRAMVFFYVNPVAPGPFASAAQLTRIRLPSALRLKIAALSPFDVEVHATQEALEVMGP